VYQPQIGQMILMPHVTMRIDAQTTTIAMLLEFAKALPFSVMMALRAQMIAAKMVNVSQKWNPHTAWYKACVLVTVRTTRKTLVNTVMLHLRRTSGRIGLRPWFATMGFGATGMIFVTVKDTVANTNFQQEIDVRAWKGVVSEMTVTKQKTAAICQAIPTAMNLI
jgi:hypothetical protein